MATIPCAQADTRTGPYLKRKLQGHRFEVTTVAFSPVGSSLLKDNRHARHSLGKKSEQIVSASLDGALTLWNFFHEDACDPYGAQRVTNSNERLADGHGDNVRAYRFDRHSNRVNHVAFSPSGNLLASASSDKTVRLWVPSSCGDSVILRGHSKAVRCVDFSGKNGICSQSSSLLITCSDDKTVKVWQLPSKRFQCSFAGHSNWVRSVQFSPDANLAASGSDDKTVKIWDVQRGSGSDCCLSSYHDHKDSVNSVSFHCSGTCLASGSVDCSIRLYDLRSKVLLQHFRNAASCKPSVPKKRHGVSNISFHPNGNYLLSSFGGTDDHLKIWDLREGRMLHCIPCVDQEHEKSRRVYESSICCAFSSDGKYFASGGDDKLIRVWQSNLRNVCGGDEDLCNPATCRRAQHQVEGNWNLKEEASATARKARERPTTTPPLSPRRQKICPNRNIEDSSLLGNLANSANANAHKFNVYCRTTHSEKDFVLPDLHKLDSADSTENDFFFQRHQDHSQISLPYSVLSLYLLIFWCGDVMKFGCDPGSQHFSSMLEHIAGQLDYLRKTVAHLDKRLTIQEDCMAQLMEKWREQ